ncbi:cytochrome c-type biogenesis protein CcsB [Micromonospora pattaloongensis]|uniref:Cytochrome c-type biogenesis protein CcsB n=1 Tax=Micromonospora pattaloongensis TaxID=405436 RepID=A0A1H3SFM7_9ACTN|nr:c-type cytochrome biogenesis protein CcsB [Micromonospora pattaloongensis]SDZ36802.1 cytochrome c-type biogenesis protein CcsB [Micromonospora pattaloongensis]
MAELSNLLLVVAILAYLLAMVCHAAEYAFGSRSVVARAATRPARELVAVGAGAPMKADLPPAPPGPPAPPARSGAIAGRAAVIVTALAGLAHLGSVVTRGVAAQRFTWGNMYEFALTITLVATAAWLVLVTRRPELRHLGLFVALAMVLMLGTAGMVFYTEVGPLMPALKSSWFIVHVAGAAFSSGIFLLGFVPAMMYLIRSGYDRGKRSFPYTLGRRVPAAAALERLTFRLHAFAFPIWTFAVAAGAIWAEAAWGRYWGWDPKETWAFISWVVYAGYLHARATPSVKRSTATWIAILGFLTMLMNLIGVNLFFSGLHSYAGV